MTAVRALGSEALLLRRLGERGIAIERRSHFHIGAGRDVRAALEVVFAFAAEPVAEHDELHGNAVTIDRFADGDLLLFEAGVRRTFPPGERHDWSMPRDRIPQLYELSLTRQFSFDHPAGEYEGMNAVSLTVQYEPTAALRAAPGEELWGTAGPAWTAEELVAHGRSPDAATGGAAWRRAVEATPAFTEALATEPSVFFLVQSDI